jgi:hypothetical protein
MAGDELPFAAALGQARAEPEALAVFFVRDAGAGKILRN